MYITARLRYVELQLKDHILRFTRSVLSWATHQMFFKGSNCIRYLTLHHYSLLRQKQGFLDSIGKQHKIVFYVFRDLHLIDWFIPIHRALEQDFPGQFAVLYINFGSSLKKVGTGFDYLPYLKGIEQRLEEIEYAYLRHFSDQEIELFNRFPQPDLIVTTETIRKECFQTRHRVYLPHYTVPKANDTLPEKIDYNHVFLPTKAEFSYSSLAHPANKPVLIHQIGYPKLNRSPVQPVRLFDDDHPTILYAPSLDIKLIRQFINQGLLSVFKTLQEINLVIKLHPTLSSKMHYLYDFLCNELKREPHIRIDTKTNIQALGPCTSALIADFGSVGAEYRLSFGKRVVYLQVPDRYQGGADLRFRDGFADAITTVKTLESSLHKVLTMGDLKLEEWEAMKDRVLFNRQNAAQAAARKIHEILH
jgi:hypothetical protein